GPGGGFSAHIVQARRRCARPQARTRSQREPGQEPLETKRLSAAPNAVRGLCSEKEFCRTLELPSLFARTDRHVDGGGDVLVEHDMKLIIKKTVLAAAALALFADSSAFAGRQHLNRARLDAARSQGQAAPQRLPAFPTWPRLRLA